MNQQYLPKYTQVGDLLVYSGSIDVGYVFNIDDNKIYADFSTEVMTYDKNTKYFVEWLSSIFRESLE